MEDGNFEFHGRLHLWLDAEFLIWKETCEVVQKKKPGTGHRKLGPLLNAQKKSNGASIRLSREKKRGRF